MLRRPSYPIPVFASFRHMFDLKDVTFKSDGKHPKTLLDDITVSFPTGEFSAIVGHNGSGKSTLLKLLARKNKPASGDIHLDRAALAGHGTRDFARKVAYLPQNPVVPPHLSVRELVAFGRYPWRGAFGRYRTEDHVMIDRAMSPNFPTVWSPACRGANANGFGCRCYWHRMRRCCCLTSRHQPLMSDINATFCI